jgi:hypothetical protein
LKILAPTIRVKVEINTRKRTAYDGPHAIPFPASTIGRAVDPFASRRAPAPRPRSFCLPLAHPVSATARVASPVQPRPWKLNVNADHMATLTCEDGNGKAVYEKAIEDTDCPLPEIAL